MNIHRERFYVIRAVALNARRRLLKLVKTAPELLVASIIAGTIGISAHLFAANTPGALAQVNPVRENLRLAIEESGASLTQDGALPAVLADGPQLTQVFQNLIGNAIRYRSGLLPEDWDHFQPIRKYEFFRLRRPGSHCR